MNNKNLFDLLGNDVEDDTVVALPPKEVVKKTTSSKKQDVPPPSANVNKANKNKPKVTGNEAALKEKPNNRSVSPPVAGGAAAGAGRKAASPGDRRSRSSKVDSDKKIKKSWGDDEKELETELAAEIDTAKDLANADDTTTTLDEKPKQNLKSVEEYFQELKLKQEQLETKQKTIRKVESGSLNEDEVIIKESHDFFPGSNQSKKSKSKSKKEKNLLDINAVFSDEVAPQQQKKPFSGTPRGGASRGAPRGGASSSRGGARGGSRGGSKPVSTRTTNKNDIASKTSFPELA